MNNNNNSLSDSYRTLDLPLEPAATEAELKAAHKLLVNVWHPDRFTGNPKLQAKATVKLQQINAAREEILAAIAAGVWPESPNPEIKRKTREQASSGRSSDETRYKAAPSAKEQQARDIAMFKKFMSVADEVSKGRGMRKQIAQVWGDDLFENGRTPVEIAAILKAAGGGWKVEIWERFGMEPKLRIFKVGFISRVLKKWLDKRKQEKNHGA